MDSSLFHAQEGGEGPQPEGLRDAWEPCGGQRSGSDASSRAGACGRGEARGCGGRCGARRGAKIQKWSSIFDLKDPLGSSRSSVLG